MPLVIDSLRGWDTHMHTDICGQAILRNQAHAGLWPGTKMKLNSLSKVNVGVASIN